MEVSQHSKYFCEFCGKVCMLLFLISSLNNTEINMEMTNNELTFNFVMQFAVKWKAVGIWGCKDCGKVKVGGAYTMK